MNAKVKKLQNINKGNFNSRFKKSVWNIKQTLKLKQINKTYISKSKIDVFIDLVNQACNKHFKIGFKNLL